MPRPWRVVQITDRRVIDDDELQRRLAAADPTRLWVQLRDPHLPARELLAWGRAVRAWTRDRGVPLLVNDRLDLALLLEADGMHLGRTSLGAAEVRRALGSALVTRSVHDEAELARAVDEGVDAALVSPIFASPGKPGGLGPDTLRRYRPRVPASTALIALGGVTPEVAPACVAAGADGVASIRADLTALTHR